MTFVNRLKIRVSVLAVVLGTAGFGGLLALERVAPSGGARTAAINVDLRSSQGDHGNGGGDHDKHCDDGKGKDDQKNKHCRPVSGHEDPCDHKEKDRHCDEGDHGDGDHGDSHGGDHGHDDGGDHHGQSKDGRK
jgi:hypothetical protein